MPVASPVCWALSALALLAGAGRQESSRAAEPAELSVADFGATPNDGENDASGPARGGRGLPTAGAHDPPAPARAIRPAGRGGRAD